MLLFAALACVREIPVVSATQPPIQALLVLHVDPLVRGKGQSCRDPDLEACAPLLGFDWVERDQNLDWLAGRWLETGRTVDVQVGPEEALAWSAEPEMVTALAASLGVEESVVLERGDQSRGDLEALLGAGIGSLGVHVHTVLPDDRPGYWGVAGKDEATVDPCASWEADPLEATRPDLEERIVRFGVESGARLALALDTELESFSGYAPLTMAGKIAVVEDPDAIDGVPGGSVSDRFRPRDLSSAYMECFTHAVDHPPFETWPSHDVRALAAGEGPMVVPGARVPGSMAPHLGQDADGSYEADARRLLQLLVSWRYAGLAGQTPRPWTFTFTTHTFDLYEGTPDPNLPEDRQLDVDLGMRYRADLEALAARVDTLALQPAWGGVDADGASVARWVLPRDLASEGSTFAYAVDDEPPPTGLDPRAYPYLWLVAERLAETHLVCEGLYEDVLVYGFERCSAGWSWGEPGPGYACTDGSAPEPVYLLVPEGAVCIAAPTEGTESAPVDGATWPETAMCGSSSLDVPIEGLLVETRGSEGFVTACARP